MFRITSWMFILLLSGLAAGQSADSLMRAGDALEGTVVEGSTYVAQLGGLAGEAITIALGPAKGSKLRARIELVDMSTDTALASADAKKKKVSLKKVVLPTSGGYELRVTGLDGTSGGFKLKTKAKLPAELLKPQAVPGGGNPGSIMVEFEAKADTLFTAKIRPAKKSAAIPGTPVLTGPAGVVPLADYMKTKGNTTAIKNVPLPGLGDYTLTVDNVGAPGEITAAVKLRLKKRKVVPYEFGGPLVLSSDVLYIGETEQVGVTVPLTDTAKKNKVHSARLVRSRLGQQVALIDLWDDGVLGQNGDEIEGDRIYSGLLNSNPVADDEGLDQYFVLVKLGGAKVAISPIVNVLTTNHLTVQEVQEVMDIQTDSQALIEQALLDGTLAATLADLKADLLADPAVLEVGESEGGRGLWVLYSCGVTGVLYSEADGVKGGAGGTDQQGRVGPILPDEPPVKPYESYFPLLNLPDNDLPPESPDKLFAKKAEKNLIGSNKVRVIAAQYFDWGEGDDIPKMSDKLMDSGCFEVSETQYTSKGSGSVEDFKGLGNYGVVLISSHGDSFYQFLSKPWKAIFGWSGTLTGQVVLHSNMKATAANVMTYEKDLRKGRMVFWYGNYGITPSFIRHYSGNFPNSLVYMSICRGTFNTTLAQAFLDKGAGAFMGYSDYVAVSFCESIGPPLLDKLLMSDMTLETAGAGLIDKKETDSDPATFTLHGSKTLELEPGLRDPSFESGNVHAAWTPQGDARIVSQLGGFGPTEGGMTAIISTGLGFTTTSGDLTQRFCMPAEATEIIFDWNFFSEEFIEYCGSAYQDTFTVTLTDPMNPGNTATLFQIMVDDLCGPPSFKGDEVVYKNPKVFPVSVGFDQGDVWATGWKSHVASIPMSLTDKMVELTFSCSDVGDSIYDTAILIDHVELIELKP